MSDIRNKLAKIARAEGERRAFQLLERAAGGAGQKVRGHTDPIRCQCGHDHRQVDLVAITARTWPRQTMVYCDSCVPDDLRADLHRAAELRW